MRLTGCVHLKQSQDCEDDFSLIPNSTGFLRKNMFHRLKAPYTP